MSDAIGMEVQFFLTSVLWGIILLVIYDVLRIIRRIIKHAWFFVAVEDVLFWIVSAFLIFRMMYEQNNGIIRGFSILGMTLGMVVYNQSLSEYMVKWISGLFLWIGKGIRKVAGGIWKPIRFLLRRIKWFFQFVGKKITKNGKRSFRGLKKRSKTVKIALKNK